MLDQWVDNGLELDLQRPNFILSNRRIFTSRKLSFTFPCSIGLDDCGYTGKKLNDLTKSYYHKDSFEGALALWEKRGPKPGSVSFSTMIETEKSHTDSSRISSKIGPCLGVVSISRWPDERLVVDGFWRSTEYYKKFPADLIWIDRLLEPFQIPKGTILNCYFANLTLNAMYNAQLLVHLDNPVAHLKHLAKLDPQFHKNVCRNLRYYLMDNTGIKKFAQALRVEMFVKESMRPSTARSVVKYLESL